MILYRQDYAFPLICTGKIHKKGFKNLNDLTLNSYRFVISLKHYMDINTRIWIYKIRTFGIFLKNYDILRVKDIFFYL